MPIKRGILLLGVPLDVGRVRHDRPAFKRGSTGQSPVNGAGIASQPGLPGFGL